MSSRKPALSSRPAAALRQLEKPVLANDTLQTSPGGRRRSNSQSQVVTAPLFLGQESGSGAGTRGTLAPAKNKATGHSSRPQKRYQAEYYVTLALLNDTFPTKHIHVPFYPETCKLGRPTGTKVKPHVSNGYFDSRVLSRNHACMFVDAKLGLVMVQDMGLSNGTFVNLEKLGAEPLAVNVGDMLNLGFNIQVETNHKQISAKIEAINVVSNSPQGPVHDVFPRLTKLALGNFGDADMRHYEFIQQLCTQLAPGSVANPEKHHPDETAAAAAAETDSRRQAARAFDYGMFSDIVPSLDEIFENSASHQNEDAGLFPNSGFRTSPELLSTLDFLSASLARIKQQNSTLISLDVFFRNYAASVDEINTRHVQEQVTKHKTDHEATLQKEREKTQRESQDQEVKLASQAQLVSTLESEIARLKAELVTAPQQKPEVPSINVSLAETESLAVHKTLDPAANGNIIPLDKPTIESSTPAKGIFPGTISEETDSTTSSTLGLTHIPPQHDKLMSETDQIAEIPDEKQSIIEPTDLSVGEPDHHNDPYLEQLHHVLGAYRNQGVLVGFIVVIAGLIYQNSKSA